MDDPQPQDGRPPAKSGLRNKRPDREATGVERRTWSGHLLTNTSWWPVCRSQTRPRYAEAC